MTTVQIDLAEISDWTSFHRVFAQALGFPDFYGNNMNAWKDCMSDISHENVAGMTRIIVPQGENLTLALSGTTEFKSKQPEIFNTLVDATARVNEMKKNKQNATYILLMLF